MDKSDFDRAFRVFWDAGYQLHIHVNGDAGQALFPSHYKDSSLTFDHNLMDYALYRPLSSSVRLSAAQSRLWIKGSEALFPNLLSTDIIVLPVRLSIK